MMIPPLIPFIENSCCFAGLLIHEYIHLRYHSHSPSVSIFFNDPIDQSRMSGMVNTFTTKSQRLGPVGLRPKGDQPKITVIIQPEVIMVAA